MQYILARRGYPPGAIDAVFGPMTDTALRNFQRRVWAVGRRPGRARRRSRRCGAGRASRGTPGGTTPVSGPVRLLRPVPGPIGDRFGAPREGGRTHTGLDFPVASGTRVGAAGVGVDGVRRLELRRLRQPGRDPPPARLHHLVRPPVLDHHLGRRERQRRHPDRLRRLDGPLDRPAPPLRAAQERGADRPDAVPAPGRGHAGAAAPAAASPPARCPISEPLVRYRKAPTRRLPGEEPHAAPR